MSEILFLVESSPESGYTARTFGADIFTEADDMTNLHTNVREAVRRQFEDDQIPQMIRLHFTHEEVIAA